MIQMPLFHLVSHTGCRAQCSQDRRCDRCNQLHNKLSSFFLTHNFLLSFLPFYLFTFNLILGTVSKTEPAPKLKSIAGLIVFRIGWGRDDAASTAGVSTVVIGATILGA